MPAVGISSANSARATTRVARLIAVIGQATRTHFGVIVESLGSPAAQLVVERAIYNDAIIHGRNVTWAAGANAMGTRLR